MSEKMRQALIAYMAAGVGNSTDYEKQADARRLALEALAEQPAPAVPDGWLRVIDEAMVVHHVGVADADDDYECARKKLNLLLCVSQDIGALHAVPEGWKVVPVEPNPQMREAGMNCWSPDDTQGDYLEKAYAAMLATAPEVKP